MANAALETKQKLHDLKLRDKSSVRDFIEFWRHRSRVIMRDLEQQAFLQLSWVLGHQTYEYDYGTSTLVDTSDSEHAPWWQVNAIENRLLPIVEGRLSKLLSTMPIWKVPPATTASADEQVSRIADHVMRHYWNHVLNMREKIWEWHWWAEVTGTGFLVTSWDPEAGPVLSVTPNDFNNRFDQDESGFDFFRQIFGTEESPAGEEQAVAIGDVTAEVRTLFEVFVDPAAKRMEDANFVLIKNFRTLDYLEDRYGSSKTSKLVPGVPQAEAYIHGHLMQIGHNQDRERSAMDELIEVQELWVKDSKKRRRGIHAVYAQGQELQRQENPYQHKQIPVSVIQGIPLPMSVYGTSKVAQLMETQARLNDIRSNKTEYMMLHVHPKILDPDVGDVDDEAFTTAFGERILYQPGFKPEYMIPPALPTYLERLENDALQAMQDLGDLHEVTQGQAPEDVKSGRAILALQAQDEARFGVPITVRNVAVARAGRQVLSNLNQFVTEQRLLRIAGEDAERDIDLFKTLPGFIGSDLVGPNVGQSGIDYFRVEVDIGSGLPMTPEGKRAVLSDLIQGQFLNPQTDRELVLRLSGLGTVDPAFNVSRIHRSMAMQENRRISEGDLVDPKKFNQHQIHLEIHLKFMNSSEFERLSPELQKQFEMHVTKHQHLMTIEALRPQIMAQIAMQVGPGMIAQELQEIMGTGGQVPAGGQPQLTDQNRLADILGLTPEGQPVQ